MELLASDDLRSGYSAFPLSLRGVFIEAGKQCRAFLHLARDAVFQRDREMVAASLMGLEEFGKLVKWR